MDSENHPDELVTGMVLPSNVRASLTGVTQGTNDWYISGRSTFFVPNPETEKAVSEPQHSVQESLKETSETVRHRDAVKVTSARSSASVDDFMDSQRVAHGTRPVSYTSVTSQDVNSLLRRMVSGKQSGNLYSMSHVWYC